MPRRKTSRQWRGFVWHAMRLFHFTWRTALTLLIPTLVVAGWYIWQASQFDLTKVKNIPARTILQDRHGEELDTIHGTNRRLLRTEEIPPFLKEALLVREDSRFMEHGGVDLRGLLRASARNLKDLDFTQGASTLTMQLARNSYDLREKKSLNRKFLEIALTYRIESNYTKDEILTHYLNRIYFGSGCHGLEEAARTYFDIPAAELNRNQSALLVGIIRGPHAFSPLRDLKAALKQRDEVLARMDAVSDDLSEGDLILIRQEPLNLQTDETSKQKTSHVARALRRPLEKALNQSHITVGGLTVVSTIEAKVQKALEDFFSPLNLPDDCQVAALALDPKSGEVLGVVGCRGAKAGSFNRALDTRRGLGPQLVEPLINAAARERAHVPIPGRPVITGRQLGEKETKRLLRRFGLEGQLGTGDDLYRGTLTISPIELATAFATLVNQGQRPKPHFIREVKEEGHLLIERSTEHFPAFSTHAIHHDLPELITGLSPSRADLWGALIDEQFIIVTWIGHDQPRPLNLSEGTRDHLTAQLRTLLPEKE